MNDDYLPTVEVETAAPVTASVVWLHGLGADGHDFEAIVPELRLPSGTAWRFVLPHAPQRPVTINAGMVMRAWYDLMPPSQWRDDEAGIHATEAQVVRLIEREVDRGVAPARIVLAGFSQGGAIALHTGLRYAQRLAGILALSTHLPLADGLAREASPGNRDVPIFLAHGRDDPLIPLPMAAAARARLADLGYPVDWHEYAMAHSVCPEEIADIRAWLLRMLAG